MIQLEARRETRDLKSLIEILAHGLFVLLLIALPTSKGLASVGVTGLLILSIVKLFLNIRNLPTRLHWLSYSSWGLLVFLILSFLLSENKLSAWSVLYRQNTLLILPLAFWLFCTLLSKHLLLYFNLFIASVSFCSLLTLFFFFLPEATTIQITARLSFLQDYIVHEKQSAFGNYSPFLDRLHFSYLLGTALLLQLYLGLKKSLFSLSQIVYVVLFSLNIACFLVLGGRGAQLGFLASGSIWMIVIYWKFIHQKITKKFSKVLSISILSLGLIIGLLVLPYLLYQNVTAIKDRYRQLRWEIGTYQDNTFMKYPYEHFTSLRRIMSWKYNWEMIEDRPLLGRGIGDYQNDLQQLYNRDEIKVPVNSHQQLLYFWATTGLMGFLFFAFLLFIFLRKSFQQKTLVLKALLSSFWLFYFIIFLFDTPLLYQTGGLAFWTFFLLFIHPALHVQPFSKSFNPSIRG